MMHKKARKQFAEDKQTKDVDYWNHVLWSDETKINLHYIAKSIGSPLFNERFDYFSNFHEYKS